MSDPECPENMAPISWEHMKLLAKRVAELEVSEKQAWRERNTAAEQRDRYKAALDSIICACGQQAKETARQVEKDRAEAVKPALNPHCEYHNQFEYDCIDCDDARAEARERCIQETGDYEAC